mmetsp:Transcript_25285/g.43129  ORF Transcript_25285/g.43129 Transcript_25285/m.43129 type:complete len:779 (+) Transcript_25285:85-2421(+)
MAVAKVILLLALGCAEAMLLQSSLRRVGYSSVLRRVRGGQMAMSAVASNPLLVQDGLPKFSAIKASDVKPAVSTLLQKLESDVEALEKSLEAKTQSGDTTYSDVIEALEVIEDPVEYAWGVVSHLTGVLNSDELRQVHQEMQPDVVRATTKISQSTALYEALKQVDDRSSGGSDSALDEAQQRVVTSSLNGMKLSGVGLQGADKKKFNENKVRLSELSTTFGNNVLDATKAYGLTLTSAEDVAGLPPSALALCAQMANAHQATLAASETAEETAATGGEATAEAGPWRLGLDMPSYLPAMKYLKSASVRETLYRAFVTRAGTANEPLITEILTLKKEQAQLLGFSCHAEVSIESKMAADVAAVAALTEQLRDKAYPAAIKELDTLTTFALANGFESEGKKLELWDVPFWSERQSESVFGFEEEQLRPYFALPNVLAGLFGLCKRLFGVNIVAADSGEAEVWHPDVQFFKVFDEATGVHVASFFLDPYSRPATKRGGAWMAPCSGKSSVIAGRNTPTAYLTCNGSPPLEDKATGTLQPSLMTFNEVITLFHETGHGLQHMLTTVPHAGAAGISGVEWDAVELPSQFMENWCYDEATVYGDESNGIPALALHYATNEPLPKDLFHKLKEQQQYQAGMVMLRQLYFGTTDMELHGSNGYDPSAPGALSPFELQRQVAERFTITNPLEGDRFLCAFGHIFAGGYSAGYYSYKWAEVLSADAFAAFEEVGLGNEEAVRATGRRFRDTVLSQGGGRHPSDVYRDFRGKDPSPEALLRHNGLLVK